MKRGETITSEDLLVWPIIVNISGVISLQHLLEDGRKTIASIFMPGDLIDMRGILNRSHGHLIALGKVEICRLSPTQFEAVIGSNVHAQRAAWNNQRNLTFRAIEHATDLSKKQALEKLASFLFECGRLNRYRSDGRISIPIRRIDLADYLGMQPETVSRCFRELEERGIIAFDNLSTLRALKKYRFCAALQTVTRTRKDSVKPMTITSKHSATAKTGVLLINLGTPDATDYWSMRRFLRQFLSDKRVVEARGPVWWLVFNAIILTRRPRKSGRAYDRIWDEDRNESPLRTFTRAQSDRLSASFSGRQQILVDWAMRYGSPSIDTGINRLVDEGCRRIVLFPLYPQYSSATSGTAMDAAFDTLKTMRAQPAIRSISPYFDHPAYIDALARSVRSHYAGLSWQPEVTIASFHGLPHDFIVKGDPYQDQTKVTAGLLRDALGLSEAQMPLTYQSRSGRRKWLEPGTKETVRRLAREGIRNLSIVAPGFAADGVETLEELDMRARDCFLGAGGENFTYVPCLNDSDLSISMLAKLINEDMSGWA